MKIVLLFISLFLLSCAYNSKDFFTGLWFVEGEQITISFKENSLIINDSHNKPLVKAQRFSTKNNKVVYRILWHSKTSLIKEKYPLGKDIVFRDLIADSGDASLILELPSKSKVRYYFRRSLQSDKVYYFSLLMPFEQKAFINSVEFKPIDRLYSVIPVGRARFFNIKKTKDQNNKNQNKKKSKNDRAGLESPNLLLDKNYSSYFRIKGIKKSLKSSIEFLFYNKNKRVLAHDLRLRAIGFVLHPKKEEQKDKDKINKIKDRPFHHRLKTLGLKFTKGYDNSLGDTGIRYASEHMDITLKDKKGLQIVYFFKDIYTRGVRLNITGIYPGALNEFRLYEVIFYLRD